MARTVNELLEQLERFVPRQLEPLRPIFAGYAAMLRRAEQAGDECATSVSHGGAEGIWLTLLARGYGVERSTDESDDSLRGRLRNVEQKLTKARIVEVANELLAPLTSESAVLLEHWANGQYLDQDVYADQEHLLDRHNAFTLVVPLVGELSTGLTYCDSSYLDQDAYAGSGDGEDPVYTAILVEVDRLRAAGVRWWLRIEP